jgi:hypothetical protein
MGDEERKVDETRRNLIRAGWVIPAVLAAQLPAATNAFASPGVCQGLHTDAPHVDALGQNTPHVDSCT